MDVDKQTNSNTFGFVRMGRDNAFCQPLEFPFPLLRQPDVHLLPWFILLEFGVFEVPLAVFPPQVVGHSYIDLSKQTVIGQNKK